MVMGFVGTFEQNLYNYSFKDDLSSFFGKFAANSGPSMILKLCHPYDIMYCNNETELSDRFSFEREIHHMTIKTFLL